MKNLRLVLSVAAGCVIAAVVAISLVAGTPGRRHAGRSASVSSQSACPAPPTTLGPISQGEATCVPWTKGPKLTQEQSGTSAAVTDSQDAVQELLSNHRATNVTRTAAVETTWDAYFTISNTGKEQLSPTLQPSSGTPIWVACASGTYTLPDITGEAFSWGCEAIAASNGASLGTTAGVGSWPTWFTKLPAVSANT